MHPIPHIRPFPHRKGKRRRLHGGNLSPQQQLFHRLGSLFRAAFFVMLAVFLCTHYTLFTADSFQNIASYLKAGASADAGDLYAITFPDTADTAIPFGNGLAVTEKGGLSVCLPGDLTQLKVSLSYSDIAADASSQYILMYNKNGTDLTLTNSAAEIGSLSLNSPILSARMGAHNTFSVITDESGYRTAVTVYNDSLKQTYKWSSSEYYIMSADLSPDDKRMAAVGFQQKGADITSSLFYFNLNSDQKAKTVKLGNSIPLRVDYLSSSTVAVLCQNSLTLLDRRGNILVQKTFSPSDLLSYDTADGQVALGLKSYTRSARSDLYIIEDNGKISDPLSLEEDVRTISLNHDRLAVMTTNQVMIYDKHLTPLYHYDDVLSAKDVILKEDGSFYLVYAKYALILTRSDSEEVSGSLLSQFTGK